MKIMCWFIIIRYIQIKLILKLNLARLYQIKNKWSLYLISETSYKDKRETKCSKIFNSKFIKIIKSVSLELNQIENIKYPG